MFCFSFYGICQVRVNLSVKVARLNLNNSVVLISCIKFTLVLIFEKSVVHPLWAYDSAADIAVFVIGKCLNIYYMIREAMQK